MLPAARDTSSAVGSATHGSGSSHLRFIHFVSPAWFHTKLIIPFKVIYKYVPQGHFLKKFIRVQKNGEIRARVIRHLMEINILNKLHINFNFFAPK